MKHISFDVWGTILQSNPNNNTNRAIYLKEHFQLDSPISDIQKIIKDNGKSINELQESTGIQVGRSEIFERLLRKFDLNFTADNLLLVDAIFQQSFLDNPPELIEPGYADAIAALNTSHNLSILSNTVYVKGENIQKVLDGYLGSGLFDFTLYSDQLGYSKPHENVYRALIGQSGVTSTEIVHIGDSVLCDIEGPQKYKINTSQVHSNGRSLTSVIDEIN
jgi:putative hydrolase of the HAD superfamily